MEDAQTGGIGRVCDGEHHNEGGGDARHGETVDEMLRADLDLEFRAHADLKDGIEYCESIRDYVSRDLFQKILDDEEEHVDWLETQLGLIDQVGMQNYLQAQMEP